MTNEPKGIALKDLDTELRMSDGMPSHVVFGNKKVNLTRKIAIVQALEVYSDTAIGDKFKAYDLGTRFGLANGKISINIDEAGMIKSSIEKAWPQPGVYVPLCRWLEGVTETT